MAYEYYFLDETSINPGEKGTEKTRTIHFIGSQAEVEAWMPIKYDPADFTYEADGVRWAGAEYHIHSVRADAINRFEYKVMLVARNWKDNSGMNYNPQNVEDILNKTESEIQGGEFTVTAKMAGYKLDPATNGYIIDTSYTENTDNPFTTTLSIADINVNHPLDVHRFKRWVSGTPLSNSGRRAATKGLIKIKNLEGRVARQTMVEIEGEEGEKYTEWEIFVEVAPDGFTWNPNWKGIK